MKKLGLSEADESGASQAMETYARLFDHPLSTSDIVALAALFGWSVDDAENARVACN